MADWYERACKQLEEDLEAGLITDKEYSDQMRELGRELQGSAEEAAEAAYNDAIGNY